jgi:hypothetical protein
MNPLFKLAVIVLAYGCCTSCKKGIEEAQNHQAIHETILHGELTPLNNALRAGISINEVFVLDDGLESQTTLLHAACLAGNREAVKVLLNSGANPNLRDGFDRLPIELAIDRKENDVISMLEDHQLKKGAGDTIDHMEIISMVLRHRAKEHQKFRAVTCVGDEMDGNQVRELLISMGLRITQAEDDPAMTITIDRPTPSLANYLVDMDAGPLSGGFDQGSFQKTHGFWIQTNVRGGVR